MNQFSHPISPIRAVAWLFFALFSVPGLLQAQFKPHFPTVDVTTDVMGWTEKSGSIAAQVSTFHWLGLRAGIAYSPQQGQTESFYSQSKTIDFLGEARLFPFGSPRKVFKKDTRPTFWKKPKIGCTGKTCLGEVPSNGFQKALKGLFIAPGFSFSRHDEVFFPKAEQRGLNSIEGYENHTIKKAPVLTTGYQIRLRNLSLGAGYMLIGGMEKSTLSPNKQDRNTGNPNGKMFPMNIQIRQKWCIEAGVNF